MKTRIVFGIIIISSFCWIGYALWLVDKQQQTLSIQSFYRSDLRLYIINRADDCLPEMSPISINELDLHTFIGAKETFSYWKSVGIQRDSTDNFVRILLEEKAAVTDEYLQSFLENSGVWDGELPAHNPRVINGWHIARANGFLALSNQPILLQENQTLDSTFMKRVKNRDIHASYSMIDNIQSHEVYCFEGFHKHFISTKSHLKLQSKEVSDLELYAVLPFSTNGFFFMEKSLLMEQMEGWKDESFENYIDKGVIFSNIENKTVLFIDINGHYVPQEILTEYARDKSTLNSQIIQLNRSVASMGGLPYATGIENILIISEDKDVLERVRLSYQMGDLFITSPAFAEIKSQGAHSVHFRWYNPINIGFPWENQYSTSLSGYGIYTTDQLNTSSIALKNSDKATHLEVNTPSGSIVWNFTLENKNSQFFLNEKNVCVYNPEKKTISIVNNLGKVITWIQLTENLKTIHPMEGGFLIEQFNQLIWMEENPPYGKKEIPFSGAIASTIAPYIWKNVPSIGLISENKLYRISLQNGKSEITTLPGSTQVKQGQLHAFNHEGDLSFGVFTDSLLHLYNSKKDRWQTSKLEGKSVWSKKMNGKVVYLTTSPSGYIFKEIFKTTNLAVIETEKKYHSTNHSSKNTFFTFKQGASIDIFTVESKTLHSFKINMENPEMVVPLIRNSSVVGLISLNGILNEMTVYTTNNGTIDTNTSQITLNASQFIKFVESNKVITFIDGQLVMYGL